MSGNPPKDDPAALGQLNKREMAMIVIGSVLVLIVGTYSATVIIAVWNGAASLTITGSIDLGLFQGVVFTIAGAGILYLGITQGSKVTNAANSMLVRNGFRTVDDSGAGGRQGTLEAIQARLEWYDKDIEGHQKNIKKWKEMKEKISDPDMKAYCDALITEEEEDIKETEAQKQVQFVRLERYKKSGHW